MKGSTIITCAVTGNHTTRAQHPKLPVTAQEIATACLEAAEEGAAIVHIHVRDPETSTPSMDIGLYEDVVQQIRNQNAALIINLTTGPGGRFHPSEHDPVVPGPRTNLLVPEKRVEHVALIKPDIATLDLNTMTFGREVVINTPGNVARMARVIRQAGVRPELELFDSGDIALCHDLIKDGALDPSPLCSIVMGVKYGFQPSPETLLYARNLLPPRAIWTGFGTGRWAFPMVAQAVLAEGNVRVGLEDSVYISKGELAASNAAMVKKARRIIEDLGRRVASAEEVRELLDIPVISLTERDRNAPT
ncbi:3-keto-5-aminohexanoate cleavage protein [Bradyrhizobium sp. Leo121]|uniref:3-keto-5-aminohexanoate cleavage protein n=1 Tax=Bradyrhizobium sp. Leo121 TaxID=1571195 RepID=UPI0010288E16|nr:3-keto-5-aminohexanoate cleavage protein [Bradyrhizobium sp. Leo121]RZN31435.1 NADPH:quinone reductase [Bradyrhizobium sp. Leo121]